MNAYETTVGTLARLETRLGIMPNPPWMEPPYWREPANEVEVVGWDHWAEDDGGPESGPHLVQGWRLLIGGAAAEAIRSFGPPDGEPGDPSGLTPDEAPGLDLPEPTQVVHTRTAAILYWLREDETPICVRMRKVERPAMGRPVDAEPEPTEPDIAEQLSALGRGRR